MAKIMNNPKDFFTFIFIGCFIILFPFDAWAQVKPTSKITQDFIRYYQAKNPPRIFPNLTFKNALSKDMQVSDLEGKWTLINFWASWCPPCIEEMPSLQALQDRYVDEKFRIVAIALDRQMSPEKLRKVMSRFQFGPIAAYYADWPTIKAQVDIPGLPTSYLLNPQGQMIGKIVAPMDWSGPQVIAFMDQLLKP